MEMTFLINGHRQLLGDISFHNMWEVAIHIDNNNKSTVFIWEIVCHEKLPPFREAKTNSTSADRIKNISKIEKIIKSNA